MVESREPCAIDVLVDEARAGLVRVAAHELAGLLATGALVVDIRPVEQRLRDGDLPGAVVIDRNVLEWRLDPTSPHRIADAADPERVVVVVCNEGFSSSLAAATLRRLGLTRATDLVGGFQAWRAHHEAISERPPMGVPRDPTPRDDTGRSPQPAAAHAARPRRGRTTTS